MAAKASAASPAATEHSDVTPLPPPSPEPCFFGSRPQKAQRLVQQAPISTVLVFRSAESETWAGQRMTLHANGLVQFDGSPPHGSWFKQMSVSRDDILHIDFHCRGDPNNIKRYMFIRVTGTDCYEMLSCAGGPKAPRATLMPLAVEPIVWLMVGRAPILSIEPMLEVCGLHLSRHVQYRTDREGKCCAIALHLNCYRAFI